MRWERMIKEINSVDQAIKIEDSVVKGYYDSIIEAINEWIMVEEDIADSYQKFNNPIMNKLAEDSKNTIKILNKILNEMNDVVESRKKRIQILKELKLTGT
ncbi:MAG: hypothetical protein QXZ49_01680 [Nitrososphaerota archaeon]